MPPQAMAALKRHRSQQAERLAVLGIAETKDSLVLRDELGNPVDQFKLRREFYRVLEAARLPKVRFHDLRHTYATLMLTRGVNPKIVSEGLGHSRVGITLDTYSHVLPGIQDHEVHALEQWVTTAPVEPK